MATNMEGSRRSLLQPTCGQGRRPRSKLASAGVFFFKSAQPPRDARAAPSRPVPAELDDDKASPVSTRTHGPYFISLSSDAAGSVKGDKRISAGLHSHPRVRL